MKASINKLIHSHGLFTKGILLLFALFVLVAFLPEEVRFKYDYELGRPWMHEDLYAPFDFSIQKSQQTIEEEKKALKNSAIPYFQEVDSAIYKITENTRIALEVAFPNASVNELIALEKDVFKVLNPILEQGILTYHPILENTPSNTVRVVKDRTAQDKDLNNLYTLQSAVDQLIHGLDEDLHTDSNLILNIAIENLQPTLQFDSVLTAKELNKAIQTLPTKFGRVKESERIVSKGELVDETILQKLVSLNVAYDKRTMHLSGGFWIDVGRFILIAVTLLVLALYLLFYRPDILKETNKFSFILIAFVLFIVIAELSLRFNSVSLYMIPFPLLAVLIRNFFDSALATFVVFVQVILVGLIAPNGYEFVFLQAITGVIAAFAMTNFRRRSHLLGISILVFISYSVLYGAFVLLKEGTPLAFKVENFIAFGISAGLMLLTYPIVFLFEKVFNLVSEVTLLELSDTNNALLRRLLTEAPGTFQHSLQVANLAEDAVREVGGNALLTRTAALYHDIGKMKNPSFFIENQVGGINPHDELSPEKSAHIIIKHVIDGVELARKHKLPEQIIDFIRTHHGNTRVRFFLHTAQQLNPNVDENLFRYDGPLPYSKESAILMMVDSVEAAARSLKEYTSNQIEKLVENIINAQLNEGQFNQANITLLEITEVKQLLKNRLKSLYHVRVPYPKQEE